MSTKFKIALLVGGTVTATILIVLIIFNIARNSQLENKAEEAIDEVISINTEYIYEDSEEAKDSKGFVYEDETQSTYYAELIYLTDYEDADSEYTISKKEEKIVEWYEMHPSSEMQFAVIGSASYYIKSFYITYDDGAYVLLAYVNVSGEPELIFEINIMMIITAILIGVIGSVIGYNLGRKIEENEIAKRTFFENTSHELKTPLMTISGYAEGLEKGVVTDYKKTGHIINAQTRRMSSLIEDILYISKVESGMVTLSKEKIEVDSYIQDILMPFEGVVINKGIDVSINLHEGYINADPDKLEHAISNLITNAIKYANNKINITYSDNRLSIWNDGMTLSDEEIKHVFDRFYTSSKGNTGIGLALAKEIFKLHGYEVIAKNYNGGTEFIVAMD